MDKGIGFSRNLLLPWLDAAAAFRTETDDPTQIRERLESILRLDLSGVDARRKTIDVLLGVWHKSAEVAPSLHAEALQLFQATAEPDDRLWPHWGLMLVYYSLFRECAAMIGQMGRRDDLVTTSALKQRMAGSRVQLGALKRSVERIVSSMRSWGVLVDSSQRFAYATKNQALGASSKDLEKWLLACALKAHPAEELPFADLVRLPELFPFRFTVTVDELRQDCRFAVQRQGSGWDAVRVVE